MIFQVDSELLLRPLEPDDAQVMYDLVVTHRQELGRFMHWVWQYDSVEDARFFIESFEDEGMFDSGLPLAIAYKGEFVGTIGFHRGDIKNRRVEMGYWISPKVWRQGLMQKALTRMLDYAFGQMKTNRIELRIHPDNLPSRRLAEKLHFLAEGLEREGIYLKDAYQDHVVYSLLYREWVLHYR